MRDKVIAWNAEEKWMNGALEQANLAFQAGEVPIGAVVIYQGGIISTAHNLVESTQDSSQHAELQALRQAAYKIGDWRLQDCTLYCTLEPCIMCYGAMVNFRLGRLVWGAPDLRHGALGSLYDLSQRPHPIHVIDWKGYFMQEPCQDLMKFFFKSRREENKKGVL